MPPTTRREGFVSIHSIKSQREVRIHFYSHIAKSELLSLPLFLSHLTLPSEAQWLAPHRRPLGWKFSFCSCAGHLTTLSDILFRRSPRLMILASSIIVNVFIIFVKFLDWIVAIWVKLVRLIEENRGLRFWKGVQLQK